MKILDVYTDGSDKNKQRKGNNRLGIGGIAVELKEDKIIDKFSSEILPKYMELYYGTTNCSNPTMEMLALLHAIYKFKPIFKAYDKIVFHADYIGVDNWVFSNKWKIKEPYIERIKQDIMNEIQEQNLKGKISFSWVKGHQKDTTIPDVKWNNCADLLAKGEYHE